MPASKRPVLVALLLLAGGLLLLPACGGASVGSAAFREGEDDGEGDDGGGGSGGGTGGGASPTSEVTVLAANDLGMHCMDREFSVFSILPPFNVVHAQAVGRTATGRPRLLGPSEVVLRYDAVADARGSTNSYSVGKTDFWTHVGSLFPAIPLSAGEGLTGLFMPDDATPNGAQVMDYEAGHAWFTALGIPITPTDDAGATNPFPLMRISAHEVGTDREIGHLDIVVPVAQETDCRNCHATGAIAARDASVTWATDADTEVQTKKNVLLLHDRRNGTGLFASQPVLCANCHYSPALDLAGAGPVGAQQFLPTFSHAMHRRHAAFLPDVRTPEPTCYQCHPGAITQCARGAMKTGGRECYDCHGGMSAVGGATPLLAGGSLDGTNDGKARRPWTDLPRCQSCHTGDAVSHLAGPDLVPAADGIRLLQTWRTGDASASPLLASGSRFAENPNTLYRFSRGHGGLACLDCHGSPHAIWPVADPAANDNVAAQQLQGHVGTLIECSACHGAGSLPLTTAGPHGMHNVNDPRWVDENHGSFFEQDAASCRACHGQDLQGTVLSRAAADRTFRVEDRTVRFTKGTPIGCTHCHGNPGSGGFGD